MSEAQQDHDEATHGRRLLGLLFMPSWLSGSVCVLLGFGTVIAMMLVTQFRGTLIEDQFQLWKNGASTHSVSSAYDEAYANSRTGTVFNEVFTAVSWGFVGLLAYFFILGIYTVFHDAASFEQELHYVNVDRRALMRTALIRFAIRATALLAWLGYIWAFLRAVVFTLAVAHIAGGRPLTGMHVLYGLGAAALLCASLYFHTVALRLVTLRPRVFGGDAFLL